jgi:O-antigen ligase
MQRAVFYSLMLSLASFGLNYHVGKAFIHLAVLFSIINFILAIKNNTTSTLFTKQLSLVMTGLLALSASIIFVYFLIFKNPISIKDFSNTFYPILFFAIILPSLSINKNDKTIIFYTGIISCIGLAIPGIVDYTNNGTQRTSGSLNMPIIYASCLAMISIWMTAEFFRNLSVRKWYQVTLCLIAMTLGFSAIFLTGSRGPIIASVLTFISLFIYYMRFNLSIKKAASLVFMLVGIAITMSIIIPQSALVDNLKNRFQLGYLNASSGLVEGKRKITSTGIRLDMWEASLVTISDHPLTGIGSGNHPDHFQMLDQENRINVNTNVLIRYDHMHNDYIQSWLNMGLIFGSISFLFIIFPTYIFTNNIRKNKYSLIGSSICFTFIICGLTDIPAHRASSLTFFLLLICIQIAILNSKNQEKLKI